MLFVSPVTSHVFAPVVVQVFAPGEDVTVYPVIEVPPSDAGAFHETVATVEPGTAETESGAVGVKKVVIRKLLISEA